MGTNSVNVNALQVVVRTSWAAWLGTVLKRGWSRYCAWRERRRATAVLRSMSDHQLKDIGLTRGHIAYAIGGKGRLGE